MRKPDILIAVNTRNSISHVAATCNTLVVELRSRFGENAATIFRVSIGNQ